MNLKSEQYPWCVCETRGNLVLMECKKCKEQHNFDNRGMTINRFVEIAEAFCIIHKDCKEAKEE